MADTILRGRTTSRDFRIWKLLHSYYKIDPLSFLLRRDYQVRASYFEIINRSTFVLTPSHKSDIYPIHSCYFLVCEITRSIAAFPRISVSFLSFFFFFFFSFTELLLKIPHPTRNIVQQRWTINSRCLILDATCTLRWKLGNRLAVIMFYS